MLTGAVVVAGIVFLLALFLIPWIPVEEPPSDTAPFRMPSSPVTLPRAIWGVVAETWREWRAR